MTNEVKYERLFDKVHPGEFFDLPKQRIREHLGKLTAGELAEPCLLETVTQRFTVTFNVPTLDESAMSVETGEPWSHRNGDSSTPLVVRTPVRVRVPFEGDAGFFHLRRQYPRHLEHGPEGNVGNQAIYLSFVVYEGETAFRAKVNRTILEIKDALDKLRLQAHEYGARLQECVRCEIAKQRSEIADHIQVETKHAQIVASLGIPIKKIEPLALRPDASGGANLNSTVKAAKEGSPPMHKKLYYEWDVFISHASEDKDAIARPLAHLLQTHGLRVWYDEFSLKIGDSLRKSVDYGLLRSRFGVVILSPRFFDKHWPEQELNGLKTREVAGKKVILPIWHEVGATDVATYSPIFADRVAVNTDQGLETVVHKLLVVIRHPEEPAVQ